MNTKQYEFDAVVQHLYKQGKPAYNENLCAYRADDGCMCAVGCRIPEAMYAPEMEGSLVYGLIRKGFKLPAEVEAYSVMFSQLQDAHDTWKADEDGVHCFDALVHSLKRVAIAQGLVFNDPRKETAT